MKIIKKGKFIFRYKLLTWFLRVPNRFLGLRDCYYERDTGNGEKAENREIRWQEFINAKDRKKHSLPRSRFLGNPVSLLPAKRESSTQFLLKRQRGRLRESRTKVCYDSLICARAGHTAFGLRCCFHNPLVMSRHRTSPYSEIVTFEFWVTDKFINREK